MEHISTICLDKKNVVSSADDSKYPDVAYPVNLSKGTYAISLCRDDFGIGKYLQSSKGDPAFESECKQQNYFIVKSSRKS